MVLAKVIKNIMASAAEAELGAIYTNAQEALQMRQYLEELSHHQPATLLKTDNSTAQGIINNTIKHKRSKAMVMLCSWLRDRALQNQFYIYGEPTHHNFVGLPTKHHVDIHHQRLRPIYVYNKEKTPLSIQGCNKLLSIPRKILADNKTTTKTNPVPSIAYLCQLSHSQALIPQALIQHALIPHAGLPKALIKYHKPVGPDCHSVITKVTRTIQDLLTK